MKSDCINWLACILITSELSLIQTSAEPLNHDEGPQSKFKFFNGKLFRQFSYAEMRGGKDVQEDWFTQTLDHYNITDNRTWKQKYFVNQEYFKPDGPAFLLIAGESGITASSLQYGSAVDYAKKFGAILFTLEHRYYGESHPTSDISVENLKFLSSRQALKDLASFVEGMNSKYNLKNSKWIAFGGSYAGSLTAWLRLNYPDLIYAGVASSAPLDALPDFAEYYQMVKQSLISKGSEKCVTEIDKANKDITKVIRSKVPTRLTALKNLFRLCSSLKTDSKLQIWSLRESLATNFAGIVQYNEVNSGGTTSGLANLTIANLCDLMTQEGASPLEKYAAVNDLLLEKAFKEQCSDVSYTGNIEYLKTDSWNSSSVQMGTRQWMYQSCSEFGFFQTSSSKDIFGEFPLELFIQQCQDVYGMKFNSKFLVETITNTNTFYGKKDIPVTRIIFVNGSIDPWHALGITSSNSTVGSASSDNLIVFIQGTAHCSDYYGPSTKDSPELTQARDKIVTKLSEWLAD